MINKELRMQVKKTIIVGLFWAIQGVHNIYDYEYIYT